MLVLSRKAEEVIYIGNDIKIRILDIRGDIVSIGIEAPKSIEILRSELIRTVSDTNKEAIAIDKKIFSNSLKKN